MAAKPSAFEPWMISKLTAVFLLPSGGEGRQPAARALHGPFPQAGAEVKPARWTTVMFYENS
jgi:hypothetical protein